MNLPLLSRLRMLSARMLRAEFPVQRKRTLNTRPMTFPFSCGSAAGRRNRIQERLADLRLPAAAIVDQECEQCSGAAGVGDIEDGPALALGLHQPGPAENAEMSRQRA